MKGFKDFAEILIVLERAKGITALDIDLNIDEHMGLGKKTQYARTGVEFDVLLLLNP